MQHKGPRETLCCSGDPPGVQDLGSYGTGMYRDISSSIRQIDAYISNLLSSQLDNSSSQTGGQYSNIQCLLQPRRAWSRAEPLVIFRVQLNKGDHLMPAYQAAYFVITGRFEDAQNHS